MMDADLLIELRTEDLPPRLLAGLAGQLGEALRAGLHAGKLADAAAPLRTYCTPRRLAAVVGEVAAAVPEHTRVVRGPPRSASYDAAGRPTPALLGFVKKHGKQLTDVLYDDSKDGRERVVVRLAEPHLSLEQLLPAIVETAVRGISAPRMMRWGDCAERFVRPVRGILLRYGSQTVAASIFGVPASGQTEGHRSLAPGMHDVPDASSYAEVLLKVHKVEASIARRRVSIKRQIEALAAREEMEADLDESLLNEVAAMCEHPKVLMGRYADKFFVLPEEVIKVCMKKHMRCFPLHHPGSRLAGAYLLVADNLPRNAARVSAGYDRVMEARLADALFFYETDRVRGQEELHKALGRISYHPGLGSQSDRVARIAALCVAFGERHITKDKRYEFDGFGKSTASQAAEAAKLCKLDLSTLMVGEYPELEGVMAAHYAAKTIPQSSMHNIIAGHLDTSLDCERGNKVRDCLVLACELEKLAGLLLVGEKFTGDSDPHGMKKSAARIAEILTHDAHYGLRAAATLAARTVSGALDAPHDTGVASATLSAQLVDVVLQRARHRPVELFGMAVPASEKVFGAVFAKLSSGEKEINLNDTGPLLEAMERFTKMPECPRLVAANKRAVNIMRKSGFEVRAAANAADRSLMTEKAEKELAAKLDGFNDWHEKNHAQHLVALERLASCAAYVDRFFAEVMVNVADRRLRTNRLRLVRELHIALCAKGDISLLSA